MKQVAPILAAIAVVGAFSTAVYAQTADRAIKYRQGIMGAQGWHMGVLGGNCMMCGSRRPDKGEQEEFEAGSGTWEGGFEGNCQ